MRLIYLDYNATTPVCPAAQEAMLPFLAEHYGLPASSHALGRACQVAVQDVRGRVARLIGATAEEIVFTSGGTESTNLALKGAAFMRGPGQGHLVVSALEHAAVAEPAAFLERLGYGVTIVPASDSGVVDPTDVLNALQPDTFLVSVMHANNEIGTFQPIREIAEICRRRGILVHTDATQTVGKISVAVAELGVDMLSFSGHKMYAPKGIGALYVRREVALEPVLHGSGHERGLRAGTENVPGIIALGAAAAVVERGLEEAEGRMQVLRDHLQTRLEQAVGPQLVVYGKAARRLPNTLAVNFPRVNAADLLQRCPELCASTPAAQHHGGAAVSATLKAIGVAPERAAGSIRLSVGWYTTQEEVDRAADLLLNAWESCQQG